MQPLVPTGSSSSWGKSKLSLGAAACSLMSFGMFVSYIVVVQLYDDGKTAGGVYGLGNNVTDMGRWGSGNSSASIKLCTRNQAFLGAAPSFDAAGCLSRSPVSCLPHSLCFLLSKLCAPPTQCGSMVI